MKKVMLGLVMAIGAMLALTACSSNGAEDVAKSFLDAQVNKDFKAAAALCCDKDGKALSKEDKATFAENLGDLVADKKNVTEYEVVEAKLAKDEKSGTVKVSVTTADGKKAEQELECFLVKEQWCVAVEVAGKPEKVVAKYYDCMLKEDFKGAMDLCVASNGEPLNDQQKKTMQDMIDKAKNNNDAFEKYEIVSSEIDKSDKTKATVQVKEIKADGTEKVKPTKCTLVKGKWFVNSGK